MSLFDPTKIRLEYPREGFIIWSLWLARNNLVFKNREATSSGGCRTIINQRHKILINSFKIKKNSLLKYSLQIYLRKFLNPFIFFLFPESLDKFFKSSLGSFFFFWRRQIIFGVFIRKCKFFSRFKIFFH